MTCFAADERLEEIESKAMEVINMEVINVVEAKKHFSALMSQVAYAGQRLIVERHGKPMMAWVSIDDLRRLEMVEQDQHARLAKRLAALDLADQVRAEIHSQQPIDASVDATELLYQLRESHFRESEDLR
jgi:PHD/YefM family antitoxin component YafN of YafNO toxin-antitoxin module